MRREITDKLHIDMNEIIAWDYSEYGLSILIRGRKQWDNFEEKEICESLLKLLRSEYIDKHGIVILI